MLYINKPLYSAALLIINLSLLINLASCSGTKQISKQATQYILSDSNLAKAHVGICIYNATDNKYLYNYQSDKYFIPASNTKIITCYAAMKHLGDSLVGLRYIISGNGELYIEPTGDPTLLHPDFKNHPVYNFLQQYKTINVLKPVFTDEFMGMGWSWDDYKDDYSAQRNNLPIYGNVIRLAKQGSVVVVSPPAFPHIIRGNVAGATGIKINREWDKNEIVISEGNAKYLEVPFKPTMQDVFTMLHDTLHAEVKPSYDSALKSLSVIYSQPTDSLLKIMMHRSDNFYAEQSLLMVGNEMLGVMNDERVIDTLLKTDYKDMPQRPQWVDGSGLSRFNLFTPQDFVFVLNKMRTDYSWNRIATIFETGGTGTLNNYYKNLRGKLFAKTGSLSNNIALSGYLVTPKNKTLIFSVLVNNHTVGATAVRRAVERFLMQVQAEN